MTPLDSSQIRRIIFKVRWPAGQIIGLARTIVDTAKVEGLISQVPGLCLFESDN